MTLGQLANGDQCYLRCGCRVKKLGLHYPDHDEYRERRMPFINVKLLRLCERHSSQPWDAQESSQLTEATQILGDFEAMLIEQFL